MNEPTIFFSERGLKEAMEVVEEVRQTRLDIPLRRKLLGAVNGMANNLWDYRSFYHLVNGKPMSHDRVHNLYGYNMARAAGEALEQIAPDRRMLLYSRSSCIGMHRYAGIWQGDNYSWWAHLLQNMKMMPSLNMCGFLYTGADIGGFHADLSEDLLVRWLQLAVFTPLMRNHSAFNTRRQEPYLFRYREVMRDMIRIRYMLLPYLYGEFIRCALQGDMLFMPLAFEYPEDEAACQVEDQLMLGEALMIAPVYIQNARGRYVYLPEDMLMIRLSSPQNREYVWMEKGHHYISLELEEMAIFLRRNKILPMAEAGRNTGSMDFRRIELLCNVQTEGICTIYSDDGFSKDYENPAHYTRVTVARSGAALTVEQSGAVLCLKITDAGSEIRNQEKDK